MMEKVVIVILGGFFGFALSMFKDYFFAIKRQKTERYYLAIIVSASLETFISKCIEVVCDDGRYGERGYRESQVRTPDFEPMQLDVVWQSLDKELLYELLTLPEKINDANAHISSVAEHVAWAPDFEEFFDIRKLKYSELGLLACSITEKLRSAAKLPPYVQGEWSPETIFNEQKEIAQKAIAATEKRNREAYANLYSTSNPST